MLKRKSSGFTIVELLIVIVVIGILAAITIVAYNGMQQRARDSQRSSDVAAIVKALELYYIDKGEYPSSGGSTTINALWNTTADASWSSFKTKLAPYTTTPSDPISTPGADIHVSGHNYAYYANTGTYCGAGIRQLFILVYRLEVSPQVITTHGSCPTQAISAPASYYRVTK